MSTAFPGESPRPIATGEQRGADEHRYMPQAMPQASNANRFMLGFNIGGGLLLAVIAFFLVRELDRIDGMAAAMASSADLIQIQDAVRVLIAKGGKDAVNMARFDERWAVLRDGLNRNEESIDGLQGSMSSLIESHDASDRKTKQLLNTVMAHVMTPVPFSFPPPLNHANSHSPPIP